MGSELTAVKRRRLAADKSIKTMTPDCQAKLLDRRRSLEAHIKKFRRWQVLYMPRVAIVLEREETTQRVAGSVPPALEEVKLFLPSDCAASRALQAEIGCSSRLQKQEEALRKGQCADALTKLVSRLCAKRYLVNYRNAHVRGQRATGRSAMLIENIGIKIKDAVDKYRRSRGALM